MSMFSRKFLRKENESLKMEIKMLRKQNDNQGKVINNQIDILFQQKKHIELQHEDYKRLNIKLNKKEKILKENIGEVEYLRRVLGDTQQELIKSKSKPFELRGEMEKNVKIRNAKKENERLQEKLRDKDEKIVVLNKKVGELRSDTTDFVLKNQLLRSKLYDLEKDVNNKNIKEVTVSNLDLRSELKRRKEEKDFVVEKLVHALNVSDYILYMLGAQGGSGYFNSSLEHEIKELRKFYRQLIFD